MRRIYLFLLNALAVLFCVVSFVRAEEKLTPPNDYPAGALGEAVRLGETLVMETKDHPLTKPFVGNQLNCTSCHLDGGKHPAAGSFLQTAAAYPAWSPREKRVITLEDRVLNCFMRSQNGIRPPNGSEPSVAITAYITWLSTGSKIAMNEEKPLGPNHVPPLKYDWSKASSERGKLLYENHCLDCHGEAGEGTADGPPVWGPKSFNDGAGLSRIEKMASWLKVGMPLDDPYLTAEQAADLAAYINSHERPHFKLEEHLPAKDRLGEYNSAVKSP